MEGRKGRERNFSLAGLLVHNVKNLYYPFKKWLVVAIFAENIRKDSFLPFLERISMITLIIFDIKKHCFYAFFLFPLMFQKEFALSFHIGKFSLVFNTSHIFKEYFDIASSCLWNAKFFKCDVGLIFLLFVLSLFLLYCRKRALIFWMCWRKLWISTFKTIRN